MSYLFWDDLSAEEKIQATETYCYIRACEEECDENSVDAKCVEFCKFERDSNGYIEVMI